MLLFNLINEMAYTRNYEQIFEREFICLSNQKFSVGIFVQEGFFKKLFISRPVLFRLENTHKNKSYTVAPNCLITFAAFLQ